MDPILSLAFSIQANPGVYAVLVGSGISRTAKIPTGWEITLDLIRKLAVLQEETCDPDPANWYREKFEKEADYSDLLDELVKTPAERQQLLRPYFEPNDTEREEGEKEPTAAHRAIAALAAQGFIKVIVTTNFDRLIETALKEVGIEPTVLSSPDQFQGALPLIHTQCCVFKVHGDYLDIRIRNISTELNEYPAEFDKFLDRIFDEFGLIVCGWSAEWDGALCSAILRAPSRRFTTYWARRGEPGNKAQKLIEHRRAQVIPITDADTFFQTIQRQVESIETFSKPHPLSTEAAVASLKRYLPESRYRIQLSDLIKDTVERVVTMTSNEIFTAQNGLEPTTELVTGRVRRYEAACETLLSMALVGGQWAKKWHYPMWQEALQRLCSETSSNRYVAWIGLQLYPATLLLYALGLGAIQGNRLRFLSRILTTQLYKKHQEEISVVQALPPSCLFNGRQGIMQMLEGMERHKTPLSVWIHRALQPYAEHIIPDTDRYSLAFDKLDILMALSHIHQTGRNYPPLGPFIYQGESRNRILREIKESLSTEQTESQFVTCGIFGKTVADCEQGLADLEEVVEKNQHWPRY